MEILTITWGTLAAAGFAGLGLGIGIVLGVAILRWVRANPGGGGGKRRAGRDPIDPDIPEV